MILYDEDAFFGSGEYEVLTVSEVYEYLTPEEMEILDMLCDRAEKRRHKAELRSQCFHRGYAYARAVTNNYQGRSHYKIFDEDDEEGYNFFDEQF